MTILCKKVCCYLILFNNQRHENLCISSFVDTLWDSGKEVKILKLLKENSIVFSFIIRENNIPFKKTQGKKCWKFCENPAVVHILYTLDKKKFSGFWAVRWKFTKFLMSYLKPKVSFSLNFSSLIIFQCH